MRKNHMGGDDNRRRNLILTAIAAALLIAFIAGAERWFNSYMIRIINTCCIYSLVTMSMTLVNGNTGVFSLGNAGFMCIGAYTTAILIMTPELKAMVFYLVPMQPWLQSVHLPFLLALICGGAMAAICALLVGFPVLRFRGDYLSIATLAFSEILRVLMLNASSITNGAIGISKIPNHVSIWLAFAIMFIVYAFLRLLMRSGYGKAFIAIREDETAAEAIGIHLFKHRLISLVISGFISGIAGGMLASLVGAIDANQFVYSYINQFLLMMVLGGTGSMTGAVLGSFVVTGCLELFRFMDNPIDFGFFQYPGFVGMRMVMFAIFLLVVVLFWERGIMGSNEFSWDRIIGRLRRLTPRGRAGRDEVK